MHEMSLCQGIVDIAEEEARRQGYGRVTSVVLAVGRLGHVLPESLMFCFEVASQGTIAAGAGLVIEPIDGVGWCFDCGKSVPMAHRLSPCPECGGGRLQVTSGEELSVRSIDVA